MKRFVSLALILSIVLALAPLVIVASSPNEELEYNDTWETANPLSLNTDIVGNLMYFVSG